MASGMTQVPEGSMGQKYQGAKGSRAVPSSPCGLSAHSGWAGGDSYVQAGGRYPLDPRAAGTWPPLLPTALPLPGRRVEARRGLSREAGVGGAW